MLTKIQVIITCILICNYKKYVYNISEGDIMKNFKINSKIISIFMASIVLVGCSTKNTVKNDDNLSSSEIITEVSTPNNEVVESTTSSIVNESKITTPSYSEKEVKEETTTIDTKKVEEKKPNELTNNDNIVLNEVESLKNSISKAINSDTVSEIKEDCKQAFITLVDFIFYDGEIKGIKFDDLSAAAKQELLNEATQIDNIIMKKFPNYKEEISEKTSNAYNKASELIKKGANNIKDFAKDKLGQENYNKIKDFKDKIKSSASDVWDETKDDVKEIAGKAKDKVKNWYENFKNN